jgi:hypothetical protein
MDHSNLFGFPALAYVSNFVTFRAAVLTCDAVPRYLDNQREGKWIRDLEDVHDAVGQRV